MSVADFWDWFAGIEAKLRDGLDRGRANDDRDLLVGLVGVVSENLEACVPTITAALTVGEGFYRLTLRSPSGDKDAVREALQTAPSLPLWQIGDTLSTDLARVLVRDHHARKTWRQSFRERTRSGTQ